MAKPFTNAALLWQAQTDYEINHELIATSGLFDFDFYAAQAGPDAPSDLIGHYLLQGWPEGLKPNSWFPGSELEAYYLSAGFNGPALVTWLVQRAAGWPAPISWNEVQEQAAGVRASGMLDSEYYARQIRQETSHLDLAIHYVLVGERMGLGPSADFDPLFYADWNPDVGGLNINWLQHYSDFGRGEKRRAFAKSMRMAGEAEADPLKKNVAVVVHEASRTGAPVLGWNLARNLAKTYNVFTIMMGKGELTADFKAESVEVHGPFVGDTRRFAYFDRAISSLLDTRKFNYAIVNSIESRDVLESFGSRFIPTVLLMHEFAYSVQPPAALVKAFDWATEIVFPAPVVAKSAEERCPGVLDRHTRTLPQAASLVPERKMIEEVKPNDVLEELTRRHEVDGVFIALGAGWVQIRKGVDLFLAAAAAAARSQPQRAIHFLWVGSGYEPDSDLAYSAYLYEQLNRSGLADSVTFMEAVPDLTPVYQIADAFLLSSRLDPFPNVAIDAMKLGIPLICFKEASGTADLLLRDPLTAIQVVGHMDAQAMGALVVRIAEDPDLHARLGDATRRLVENSLADMATYVSELDALGTLAAKKMALRSADAEVLENDTAFDEFTFSGLQPEQGSRAHAIALYLAQASVRGSHSDPLRRPCPGFHPFLYRAEHPARMLGGEDPFADFIRSGKPPGPWYLPVIEAGEIETSAFSGVLRAVLHVHLYYPELAADLVAHLSANQSSCDLLVSTDTREKARQLKACFAQYRGGEVEILVTPNRGRDIGPLLTEFSSRLASYDLVGHVHGKRSLILKDQATGEIWRRFLWQNLVGGEYAMLDRILAEFSQQKRLGLVFPSDPHLFGWTNNLKQGAELAGQMGRDGPLPEYLDFPLGTMFWMRRQALQPLLDLKLDWHDYPEEPVPYDGTILHAIERLLPIACQIAGFTSAVTHVFGVSR